MTYPIHKSLVSVLCLSLILLLSSCGQDEAGTPPGSAPTGRDRPASEGQVGAAQAGCDGLPDTETLRGLLRAAPGQGEAGGLFGGQREWAAIVNRNGQVCAVAASLEDPAAVWPGALAIAKAKAYTANAYSTDLVPLSTARLYTMSQPGGSLYGAAAAHPFNPSCFTTPDEPLPEEQTICGGTIVFGGGLPLYRDLTRVGGLGASGDTPCADHEIAKRIRTGAGLNPPHGPTIDDIRYESVDGHSLYLHPLCKNTWRNGEYIGEADPAQGYPGEEETQKATVSNETATQPPQAMAHQLHVLNADDRTGSSAYQPNQEDYQPWQHN